MKSVATAAWSLNRLVTSLARAGWGEVLDGACNAGLQRVLHALADLLPWEAGEGRLTRAQVADAASMSARWAGHCLRRLEDLGVVVWHRGWLDRGRPRAGWIRVEKARLAELVRDARGHLDGRRERRREATRDRLGKLRRPTVPPWRKRAKPLVGAMGTECPPSHIRSTGAPRPGPSTHLPTLPIGADMPACAICGRSQDACERATRKEPFRIQHAFEPSTVGRRPTVLAPAHELHPPAPHKPPRSGWRQRVAELNRPAHPTLDIGVDQ